MPLSRLTLNGSRHPAPEVRQSACAAMTELREWTPDLEAALMTAAFDPEWRVVGAALHSVTLLLQRGLLRAQIPLLTAVAAKSLSTEKPLVRALAARLVHDPLQYSPTSQNRQLLEEMLKTLAVDVSYQVRQAAKYGRGMQLTWAMASATRTELSLRKVVSSRVRGVSRITPDKSASIRTCLERHASPS
jgi:hypothetical protein